MLCFLNSGIFGWDVTFSSDSCVLRGAGLVERLIFLFFIFLFPRLEEIQNDFIKKKKREERKKVFTYS